MRADRKEPLLDTAQKIVTPAIVGLGSFILTTACGGGAEATTGDEATTQDPEAATVNVENEGITCPLQVQILVQEREFSTVNNHSLPYHPTYSQELGGIIYQVEDIHTWRNTYDSLGENMAIAIEQMNQLIPDLQFGLLKGEYPFRKNGRLSQDSTLFIYPEEDLDRFDCHEGDFVFLEISIPDDTSWKTEDGLQFRMRTINNGEAIIVIATTENGQTISYQIPGTVTEQIIASSFTDEQDPFELIVPETNITTDEIDIEALKEVSIDDIEGEAKEIGSFDYQDGNLADRKQLKPRLIKALEIGLSLYEGPIIIQAFEGDGEATFALVNYQEGGIVITPLEEGKSINWQQAHGSIWTLDPARRPTTSLPSSDQLGFPSALPHDV